MENINNQSNGNNNNDNNNINNNNNNSNNLSADNISDGDGSNKNNNHDENMDASGAVKEELDEKEATDDEIKKFLEDDSDEDDSSGQEEKADDEDINMGMVQDNKKQKQKKRFQANKLSFTIPNVSKQLYNIDYEACTDEQKRVVDETVDPQRICDMVKSNFVSFPNAHRDKFEYCVAVVHDDKSKHVHGYIMLNQRIAWGTQNRAKFLACDAWDPNDNDDGDLLQVEVHQTEAKPNQLDVNDFWDKYLLKLLEVSDASAILNDVGMVLKDGSDINVDKFKTKMIKYVESVRDVDVNDVNVNSNNSALKPSVKKYKGKWNVTSTKMQIIESILLEYDLDALHQLKVQLGDFYLRNEQSIKDVFMKFAMDHAKPDRDFNHGGLVNSVPVGENLITWKSPDNPEKDERAIKRWGKSLFILYRWLMVTIGGEWPLHTLKAKCYWSVYLYSEEVSTGKTLVEETITMISEDKVYKWDRENAKWSESYIPNKFYLIHFGPIHENTISNKMVGKMTIPELETLAEGKTIGMYQRNSHVAMTTSNEFIIMDSNQCWRKYAPFKNKIPIFAKRLLTIKLSKNVKYAQTFCNDLLKANKLKLWDFTHATKASDFSSQNRFVCGSDDEI